MTTEPSVDTLNTALGTIDVFFSFLKSSLSPENFLSLIRFVFSAMFGDIHQYRILQFRG